MEMAQWKFQGLLESTGHALSKCLKAEAAIAEVKTGHRFKPKKSCKYM